MGARRFWFEVTGWAGNSESGDERFEDEVEVLAVDVATAESGVAGVVMERWGYGWVEVGEIRLVGEES